MQNNNRKAYQYKQMSVTTANRGQILIMLYEAAIQNIRKAVLCIDKKDISGKGKAIGKAHDIINELASSLDFKIGGTLAQDLERLYAFMTEQLIKANLESSKQTLMGVQKLLETLLEGWKGAVVQMGKDAPKSESSQG